MLKYLIILLFPLVSPIKRLINSSKEDWLFLGKKILLLVLPFIFMLSIFYIFVFIFSFTIWRLPDNYYFPFLTGGEVQRVFDRVCLLIGIFLMVFTENDE